MQTPRSTVTIMPQYVWTPTGYLNIAHVCMINTLNSTVTISATVCVDTIGYLKVQDMQTPESTVPTIIAHLLLPQSFHDDVPPSLS